MEKKEERVEKKEETEIEKQQRLELERIRSLQKLAKQLNLSNLSALQDDDATYWHPNRDHILHLVFEYQGKGPLPFVTHTILRRGFDMHYCRQAVLFASNEYPVVAPKHKHYAQLTSSIFRKLWPRPKRVGNPLEGLIPEDFCEEIPNDLDEKTEEIEIVSAEKKEIIEKSEGLEKQINQ